MHRIPERVGDLVHLEAGFFPFEIAAGETSLINRAHVTEVQLPEHVIEARSR